MNDFLQNKVETRAEQRVGNVNVNESGSGSAHDPWLNFSITSDGFTGRGEVHDFQAAAASSWGGLGEDSLSSPSGSMTVSAPGSESLVTNWPSDRGTQADIESRRADDLLHRRQRGDTASLQSGDRRFFSVGDSLDGLASVRTRAVSVGGTSEGRGNPLRLPEIGDTLFGFRLRYPLGRGAFARVFLAEQCELAGRPVVLKVSAIEGTEPQTLAQLQHTNIVPIYSAHEDARAGLRAVCMPYFGGASLSSILERLWNGETIPARGSEFVQSLEAVQSPPPGSFQRGVVIDLGMSFSRVPENAAPADENALLARLSERSYVQATAWIVALLAEGLHHAHQRGVYHRDIKPSNILISAEGQPLLLDFNLAQDEHIDPELATLGGTVAYMAPEHLRALAGRSAALIRQVDQRSDIYSMGMVLAEMLTGQSPFDQSASYSAIPLQIEAMAVERSRTWPSVKGVRPDIPWGLESIVRQCLAPDPARRYQRADHLVEDLRRFLDDRPLKYAPELSRAERVRKFARRHPRLMSSGTVAAAAAVLLLGVGTALAGVHDRLGVSQARDRFRAHEQGTNRALCLINTVVDGDLVANIRQGAEVCKKTLGLYDVKPGTRWEDHPDLSRLSPRERHKLAEDRRELLMLLASARVRLTSSDLKVVSESLTLLEQAEAIEGLPPSRALRLERAEKLERLGDRLKATAMRRLAETTPATTARDHYALATTYARQGGVDGWRRALAELDEALRLNPKHYWSVVQRGICHEELGEHLLAAADFGQSIGLWPEFAWGYFNRGCVLARSGRRVEAIADYTAALGRDPTFAVAAINRGLVCLEQKRYEAALADFNRARELGSSDPALEAGRGIALEGLKRHTDADAAFAQAFTHAAPRPDPARARLCWTYGFAVAHRLPEKARAAFDDVLLQDPYHPQALYGRAMLAADEGRTEEALVAFGRALQSNPSFNEARRSRAVLLARKGDWEHAGQDINWCLDREPTSGETLYNAACVAALAARATPNIRARDQALDLLRRAFEHGAEASRAIADPDLASLCRDPRFQAIVKKTTRTEGPDPAVQAIH